MTGPMNREKRLDWLLDQEFQVFCGHVRHSNGTYECPHVGLSDEDCVRIVDTLAPTAPSREQIADWITIERKIAWPDDVDNLVVADAILKLFKQHGWRAPDVLHEEADDDR